jgi:hypothetical protein
VETKRTLAETSLYRTGNTRGSSALNRGAAHL